VIDAEDANGGILLLCLSAGIAFAAILMSKRKSDILARSHQLVDALELEHRDTNRTWYDRLASKSLALMLGFGSLSSMREIKLTIFILSFASFISFLASAMILLGIAK